VIVLVVFEVFVFPVQNPTTIIAVVVPFVMVVTALSGRSLLLLFILPFELMFDIIAFDGCLVWRAFSTIHTSAALAKRSKHKQALSHGAN
jgi:hypothetical protein